ncbi:Proteoglycan 4 [Collichthys lucidus]|uniref:Proteoglycan 4 n=1 Tax=Collichthys lucidus TaxID=240159 RepID=A0A4U5UFQ6_COLLU|nr:Proteoglycan 4 [Collichthys lucidus]
MHRSYQPLKPVTNRYLQQRWDQNNYDNHRRKLQDERLSVIDRDNRLLASKLSNIVCSKGLVEHQNHYHLRSLNVNKRREELLLVSRQNQAIYQRITSRQSEYRRQLWLDDWERAERRRDDISRYPRGLVEKQKIQLRSFQEPDLTSVKKIQLRSFQEPDLTSVKKIQLRSFQEPDLTHVKKIQLRSFQEPYLTSVKKIQLRSFQEPDLTHVKKIQLRSFQEPDLTSVKKIQLRSFQEPDLTSVKKIQLRSFQEPDLTREEDPAPQLSRT